MPRLAPLFFAPLVTAIVLAGCGSTAPYTVGAAAINTAVAVGASAAQRAEGGCYAMCAHGTVCNPRSGLCESRQAGEYCEEAPGGGVRCIPVDVRGMTREGQGGGKASPVGAGVSPATGSTPPPPNEASPRAP
ncbi:hypothetical protein [Anaeromyxobacter oryzae]|uniref:Lipoprotein n=1 Tax=Anaeromyxobacter oryzae TaxID=2918170 RepID=A0ABN6MNS2_9BACT|nr:hypothetical protein [Anaeromyxobacter oryzae]BDG01275.1 hypothetical protein AMOR_02710 [Anaeromyxobacter oryzae]